MGTVALDELSRTDTDGRRWDFDVWTTTFDLSDPECGTVWISISKDGADETTHAVHICVDDYDERWVRRFVDAFVANPQFREGFVAKGLRAPHPTVRVDLPSGPADIDEDLAPAIVALNAAGAVTVACCQGGGGRGLAYIALGSGAFPERLVRAWEAAGFAATFTSVHATSPFGMEDQAAAKLVESAQDWVEGRLDGTGARYRLSAKRPSSLPKLPPAPTGADPAIRGDVARLVRMGAKAKFRDFAQLRSGRDRYSSMRLPDLEAAVSPAALACLVALDETTRAKALRWVLRGLPADMAAHKVAVDAEVSANAAGGRHSRRR